MADRSHVTYLYPDGRLQALVPFWSVGSAEFVAGWTPDGTSVMYWATADGQDPRSVSLDQRFALEFTTAPRIWHGNMLRIFQPHAWYQVLHFFTPTHAFSHWYVDFETPKEPDGHGGWTTCDLELDLIIRADHRAEWKDADELTAALAAGYLSDEVVTTMLPVAQAIHDDPGGFIRELPDWRDFPGIDGLGPLDLPIDTAWRHLVR